MGKKGEDDTCLACLQRPKRKDHQFCSDACTKAAALVAPRLLRVPQGHVMYEDIKKSFKRQWHSKTSLPTLSKVYLVTWSKKTRESFEKYRDGVWNQHQGKLKNKEVKRWRAEKRACNLGDKDVPKLCRKKTCQMCPAIRSNFEHTLKFKRDLVKKKRKKGVRFGAGIYLSPTSGRAFKYSKNIAKNNSKTLAFFSVRCVLGQALKLKDANTDLKSLAKPYNSVEGKAADGQTELVVYDKDAVRPAYLILCKRK